MFYNHKEKEIEISIIRSEPEVENLAFVSLHSITRYIRYIQIKRIIKILPEILVQEIKANQLIV